MYLAISKRRFSNILSSRILSLYIVIRYNKIVQRSIEDKLYDFFVCALITLTFTLESLWITYNFEV